MMNKLRAELILKVHLQHHQEALEYDEAIEVAEHAARNLAVTPPGDPAYGYLSRTAKTYYEYAEALNQLNGLERRDHLIVLRVIVSYNKGAVTEEMRIPINRYHPLRNQENQAFLTCRDTLLKNKVDPYAMKDLEVLLY